MRTVAQGVLFIAFFVLGGCGIVPTSAPPDVDQAARSVIQLLRHNRLGELTQRMDPQYRGPSLQTGLDAAWKQFPREEPQSVVLQSWNTRATTGAPTRYSVEYIYTFSRKALICDVVMDRMSNGLQLEGIHVTPVDLEVNRKATAFVLTGKSPTHYAFLATTVFLPLFCFFTFIVCLFTPIPRLKWLWALFVLVGLGGANFNWFDGSISFDPLHATLLSAAYIQNPFGPVILSISVPVGAFMFWFRRRAWVLQATRPSEGTGDLRV